MNKRTITIALAGNPNSGKTTVFNGLTGTNQHVGNYPGVTVERKEGRFKHKGVTINVIDLPGTYSLTAYSPDELIARQVIVEESPDLIVNVVDTSNLERNLYLTTQLMEMQRPMILVANMADVAESSGLSIDYELLSQLLGMPVVRVVGSKGQGISELMDTIVHACLSEQEPVERNIYYAPDIETEIKKLEDIIVKTMPVTQLEAAASLEQPDVLTKNLPARWIAVKLLEGDAELVPHLQSWLGSAKILEQVEKSRGQISSILGEDSEMLIIDGRYAFARGASREAVTQVGIARASVTEKIDKILLNRLLGIPIFIGVMWLLFQLTFTLGAPLMDWIDLGVVSLGDFVGARMDEGLLRSLVVDGIIGGVGGVIIFLPNILLLFLGIAFLEGSGYMARAAFVMDKVMHLVGLHGKSFVPMLTGFGCTIPAIMATRTLENNKDRMITMLVAPLMSCGARLPVYTLLIAAFFSTQAAGNILFSIYLIGILLAMIMAKVFRTWLMPGVSEPFVMELPSYRLPTLKALLLHMWERAWLYLQKAGTIILAASILMWAMFTFPTVDSTGKPYDSAAAQLEQSIAGQAGKAIEPVIRPLGFDWRTGVALISGLAAKEVVVSTMGTLYSIEDGEALAGEEDAAVSSFAQRARENSGLTPLKAYVLMLFVLIYIPCLAAVAVIKRETNGWKWPLFTMGYTVVLAWIVSFLAYHGGLLLGLA